MIDDGVRTEAARAYAAHYSELELPLSLQLYTDLIASHASAQEAGYSRTQIQNIVNRLVPAQDLPDAQMKLALANLERA